MKIQRLEDAGNFGALHFRDGSWEKHGIPENGCMLRNSVLMELMQHGRSLRVEEVILGLMDWLDVTDDPDPALSTLKRILDRHFPNDGHAHAHCALADDL